MQHPAQSSWDCHIYIIPSLVVVWSGGCWGSWYHEHVLDFLEIFTLFLFTINYYYHYTLSCTFQIISVMKSAQMVNQNENKNKTRSFALIITQQTLKAI